MADVQDESGGGVMLLFLADPVMQPQVENAMEYTIHALRQQSLMIEKHVSASKPSKPRFVCLEMCLSLILLNHGSAPVGTLEVLHEGSTSCQPRRSHDHTSMIKISARLTS